MIDRATVDKILNTADILEVVSDFVTLRKRGQSWVGLCPFHNDRNPSFYVTPSKGICKCFSCGKGGSPVNFIMEHEQLSYYEALKYLANKYHIEVHERELTDEERAAQSERESMLIVNEWACRYFENCLHNTDEGRDVGLSYFNERGFSVEMIKRFKLGYSPEGRRTLYDAALKQGFSRELLFKVGLCIDDNHGGGYDRFRGRVLFPIFNVAGKVVAFGGRTLRNDPAKYLNSPESIIYNKRNELYGLFQAKRAIAKLDKCFIVEGYADVISMHQSGFENVIASSGTALTEGHIHLLHRFTGNVTELFDGDEAGIHAALRGIDLLLAQGLNIKVLLLPDGHDPDSFSREHSASEIERYIQEHEEDFISFKSRILLDGVAHDPIKRSAAITDVVRSIAVIPDNITRSVYAKECSKLFGIEEKTLLLEIQRHVTQYRENRRKQAERDRLRQDRLTGDATPPEGNASAPPATTVDAPAPLVNERSGNLTADHMAIIKQERNVTHYVAKYGMCPFCEIEQDDGTIGNLSVVEFIMGEMEIDHLEMIDPVCRRIIDLASEQVGPFYARLEQVEREARAEADRAFEQGVKELDITDMNMDKIQKAEDALRARVDSDAAKRIHEFRLRYLEQILCSHIDDQVRHLALDLVSEKYVLSKIHTQFAVIATEYDRLTTLIPEALSNWKNALISQQINTIQAQLKQRQAHDDDTTQLVRRLQELYNVRKQLARLIGDRVVNPR